MADYEFKYAPLTGRLTGKQMIEQTEQAINGLASLVDEAAGQVTIISTLANEANENAATALETAEEALSTTGRTYITVSIPANANDYYDSQLIYIADNTSTNIPVADTGMLEVKTNDNKTSCEQVFIADSSGEAYYRHGDITAETVGDVTTYTVTWGGWSSQPASQAYVQGELANYLPLSGGTMTGALSRNGVTVNCTSDASYTEFLGGTDTTSSYIVLYGKNHSSNAGVINMRAYDGTNSSYLKLTPTGDLTWGGKDVERVHAYSISASTGYVRYTSGLQMVWGSIDSVGTTAVEETYAVAFSAYPSVVATANSNAIIYIPANNTTRFTVRTASGTTTVRYIAIGKWK